MESLLCLRQLGILVAIALKQISHLHCYGIRFSVTYYVLVHDMCIKQRRSVVFFRKGLTSTSCLLCGQEKMLVQEEGPSDMFCQCPSVTNCKQCKQDILNRQTYGVDLVIYRCQVHGEYRKYEDGLLRYMVQNYIIVILFTMLVQFQCYRLPHSARFLD